MSQISSQTCSEIISVFPVLPVCASPVHFFLMWLWCLNISFIQNQNYLPFTSHIDSQLEGLKLSLCFRIQKGKVRNSFIPCPFLTVEWSIHSVLKGGQCRETGYAQKCIQFFQLELWWTEKSYKMQGGSWKMKTKKTSAFSINFSVCWIYCIKISFRISQNGKC